jgi:hypothetical protein
MMCVGDAADPLAMSSTTLSIVVGLLLRLRLRASLLSTLLLLLLLLLWWWLLLSPMPPLLLLLFLL